MPLEFNTAPSGREWKPVHGYGLEYWVSDLGDVWSVKACRGVEGRLLRPGVRPDGRLCVALHRSGSKSYLVHHLVASAFLGPRPMGLETCHNNGVCTDNRLANLRYDTHSANELDKAAHGVSNRGARQGGAKLTSSDVVAIRRHLLRGARCCDLAQMFGVSPGCISGIKHGRSWGWLK